MDEHKKTWTYDDLASLPEGHRYEIFDGELFVDGQPLGEESDVSAAPSKRHQRVSKRIFVVIYRALEEPGIADVYFAPVDVVTARNRVLQPDLLIIDRKRETIFEEHAVTGPPDVAIEVLSPTTKKHDRDRKRRFYARIGVREYWIVDPLAETIDVLELIEGGLTFREAAHYGAGDRARSIVFGFEIALDELFA